MLEFEHLPNTEIVAIYRQSKLEIMKRVKQTKELQPQLIDYLMSIVNVDEQYNALINAFEVNTINSKNYK